MTLKSILPYVVLATLPATHSMAQTTLAEWTFETSVPTTAGPFAPEVGSGSALGYHASDATVFSNPVGNGSAESFSANTWSVGDYYQFQVNTIGFQDIIVSYDQTSSSTGPGRYNFSYSTDGVNFSIFAGDYTVLANASPNPVWSTSTGSSIYSFTRDLSSITALDNASTVYFRIVDSSTVSASGGTVGTSGTDRVDNFKVTAVAVPEPQSLALLGLGGLMLWSAVRRRS
jgi:hypothetical protein